MNKEHIIFFVDPAWRRPSQHIPLLYPFWGNPLDRSRLPFLHTLFERHSFDTSRYSITDNLSAADMILMPYAYNTALRVAPDVIAACIRLSREQGKKILVDGISDIERSVAMPNAVVLRYGGYRFEKKNNEICIPPYADDLLELYRDSVPDVRAKSDMPTVGFTGWASLPAKQELRTRIKETPDRLRGMFDSRWRAKQKGVFFRREAVSVLQTSLRIKPNFIIRTSYSGHRETASGAQETLRKEFVDNLLGSDYGLDVRGDANASTRLFEMLSLGRIPIIVDTERNFPFSDVLDYATFSLTVDFRDIKQLPERVAAFHAGLSGEQFIEMQKNARAAYLNFFRVDALMSHIIRELRSQLQ